MKHLICTTVAFLTLTGAAHALTLEEAVTSALENSHTLKTQQYTVEESAFTAESAKASRLPNLSVSYAYQKATEAIPGYQPEEGSMFQASLGYNLFNGFAYENTIKMLETNIDAEKHQLKAQEADVVLEVKKAYINYLMARQQLAVAKESVDLLKHQREDTDNAYTQGLLAKNDLLKVDVYLANASQSELAARSALRLAKRNLERLIGKKLEDAEKIDEIGGNQPKLTLNESALEDAMKQNRSELKYLNTLMDVQTLNREVSNGTLYPRVDLGVTYDNYGDTASPDLASTTVMGLSVSWTLYDGNTRSNTVKAATSAIQGLKHTILDTEAKLTLQLQQAYEAYDLALGTMNVAKKNVEQAQENFRITEHRHQQSVATTTDLLDASLLLTTARSSLNNAFYSMYKAYYELERITETQLK